MLFHHDDTSTGTQCNVKRNEEQEESQHETRRQEATHNQDSSIHQHNHARRNKGHKETTQKLNQAQNFIKEKVFTKEYKFPDWFLGNT
jgi:hypothetical protein